MRKTIAFVLLAALWTSCKKEDESPAKIVVTNVEIGAGDGKIGYIGQDFHLNADVKAITTIDSVWVEIRQQPGDWTFHKGWGEYRGLRNTNVHKHFYIPATAPVGACEFAFYVKDQNGSLLEIKTPFTIEEK